MYSFTVFEDAKENKKCHKSLSQAKVQLWCQQAKEQKSKGGGCTSKYLVRCCVSWVLLLHSAIWESQTGGRMAGQPQPPLNCYGTPCSAPGQDTAQPCRCTTWKGTMHLWFPEELMPSVLPTGRTRQGALVLEGCNEKWVSIHHPAGITHHADALSPFLLAEYNLLRFPLKQIQNWSFKLKSRSGPLFSGYFVSVTKFQHGLPSRCP